MGTLGGRARRLAKRQQYEATQEKAVAVSSTTNRPAIRGQEPATTRILKGNASF